VTWLVHVCKHDSRDTWCLTTSVAVLRYIAVCCSVVLACTTTPAGFSRLITCVYRLVHIYINIHVYIYIHTKKIYILAHLCQCSRGESSLICVCVFVSVYLWHVGTLKLQVSSAKEIYKRDDIVQKRPVIVCMCVCVSIYLTCVRVYLPVYVSVCIYMYEWVNMCACIYRGGIGCESTLERIWHV